jgi:Domain of unknown function (DUF5602)
MKNNTLFFIAVLFVTLASCKKDNDKTTTYDGAAVNIGNGNVHTFVTLDKDKKPTTIGIRMSETALDGLPTEGDPNMGGEVPGYMLNLPAEVGSSGFNHSEVDWNPHGHEPLFAYGVPHFDFHFYMITPQEQSQVVPGPDTIQVDPKYVPKDYVSGMMAVPNMGTHWVDTTSGEFHGQPFTITFIYGFYRGNMTFLEPMITKAFLLTQPDITLPIKQPQAFQRHGYYPKQAHLFFDNSAQQYVIALEGLSYQ